MELLSCVESIVSCSILLRVIDLFITTQHVGHLGDVIRNILHYNFNADTHTKLRQNRFVYDITCQADIGGVNRDMVLVERALNWARTDIVGETKRIILGEPKQVLDLTGLIKGVMALENLGLYEMEAEVGRSTQKIDLGIELYDMENWD